MEGKKEEIIAGSQNRNGKEEMQHVDNFVKPRINKICRKKKKSECVTKF